MAKPFLGQGWGFPITPAASGSGGPIQWAQDEDKVRQSIWIILTTAPGERIMQASFGCGIHERVFANLDDANIGQILNDVSSALAQWEPRIDVITLDAVPDSNVPNLLLISIDYQIRATNSRFNLVYPFYVS
jgi:Bacteriophage baseplate protein W